MKNLVRILSGAALSACLLGRLPASAAGPLEKLPPDLRGHWAAPYAITLLEEGVASGMPDGRYCPDASITREEAASLLWRVLERGGVEIPMAREGELPYADVAGRWSEEAIWELWWAGVLEDAEAFSPAQPITRLEMGRYLALTLDVLERTGEWESPWTQDLPGDLGMSINWDPPDLPDSLKELLEGDGSTRFPDLQGEPQAPYVEFLAQREVLSGDEQGNYRPQAPLSRGEAAVLMVKAGQYPISTTTFPDLPEQRVIEVPYISQLYPVNAPVGCEATSLLMGLKGKGYAQDVDLRTFLDAMPKTTSNPAKGFVGSPYKPDPKKLTRTTIYPAALTQFASQYGKVVDLTGASPEKLQEELLSGNPVVAYVTLYWKDPYYRDYDIEGENQRLLSNNHAVLVTGYDSTTHQYYIADPYNHKNTRKDYFYWVDGQLFDRLYLERCHAVAVE